MSYREKTAWISLVTLLGAFGWYFHAHGGALLEGSLGFADMLAEMIALVILIVIVEVAFHVVLGIESAGRGGGDGELEADERDALIDAKSDRWPYIVMFAGAITAIWTAAFQPPIVTAHVLLLALVVAEAVKLISQLVYYRRGI